MKRTILLLLLAIITVTTLMPVSSAWWIFSSSTVQDITYTDSQMREYLPILTNNILPDKIYARVVESNAGNAYCYMLYWAHQDGVYKLAEHDYDWEYIVVYTKNDGSVYQVNYDAWHYYIGRTVKPSVWNETHVFMFVDQKFHYFYPDLGMRYGSINDQLNRTIYPCTAEVTHRAKTEVGFDEQLFNDPFTWQKQGTFGRYTAFDSWWKAFLVVTDKSTGFWSKVQEIF
jgi:hypothetical protein